MKIAFIYRDRRQVLGLYIIHDCCIKLPKFETVFSLGDVQFHYTGIYVAAILDYFCHRNVTIFHFYFWKIVNPPNSNLTI